MRRWPTLLIFVSTAITTQNIYYNNKIIKMGEDNKTMTNPCRLCGNAEATKANSHIVPSFLVAQFASYDNSYKRDKELMFSISPIGTRVYTGALPTNKIDSTFDSSNLTDEST